MTVEGGGAPKGHAPTRLDEITQNASIEDIRLVSSHAVTHISSPAEAEKVMISLSSDGTLGTVVEHEFDVNAEVTIEVTPIVEEGVEAEPVVCINSIFRLNYELPEASEYPEEDLNQFAAVNGVFNAWPYFREIVQSTMARMGLPQVPLPLFRVPNCDSIEENDDASDAAEESG
jgi:preprotein translocase subunit SecB